MEAQAISLFDLIEQMENQRDARVRQVFAALAHHDSETLRLVLEALYADYQSEVDGLIADYQEDDLAEEEAFHDEYSDEFEDAAYYNTDFVFEDDELANEQNIDNMLEIFLENPAAINSLVHLLSENLALDHSLIEMCEKYNPEIEHFLAK